jgi:hypothetical protein
LGFLIGTSKGLLVGGPGQVNLGPLQISIFTGTLRVTPNAQGIIPVSSLANVQATSVMQPVVGLQNLARGGFSFANTLRLFTQFAPLTGMTLGALTTVVNQFTSGPGVIRDPSTLSSYGASTTSFLDVVAQTLNNVTDFKGYLTEMGQKTASQFVLKIQNPEEPITVVVRNDLKPQNINYQILSMKDATMGRFTLNAAQIFDLLFKNDAFPNLKFVDSKSLPGDIAMLLDFGNKTPTANWISIIKAKDIIGHDNYFAALLGIRVLPSDQGPREVGIMWVPTVDGNGNKVIQQIPFKLQEVPGVSLKDRLGDQSHVGSRDLRIEAPDQTINLMDIIKYRSYGVKNSYVRLITLRDVLGSTTGLTAEQLQNISLLSMDRESAGVVLVEKRGKLLKSKAIKSFTENLAATEQSVDVADTMYQ